MVIRPASSPPIVMSKKTLLVTFGPLAKAEPRQSAANPKKRADYNV